MSLLVIHETLRLCVNTFTVHNKYSFRDSENLPQPIQMQLSKKRETSSEFFASLVKSTSNFKHFK